jgi:hypothetical protein
MGAVYKYKWGRKGRYIYNRDTLHKCGHAPKHKYKYIMIMKEMLEDIRKLEKHELWENINT